MVPHEADPQHDRNDQVAQCRDHRRGLQPITHQRLAVDHLDRGPQQHRRTEVHDAGIAVDELQHDRAAPYDDRHADHQAGDDEQVAAMRGTGDGQHVVESHHGIGDHDRAHRAPERGRRRPVRVALVVVGKEQPVGDPDQREAAGEEQPRHLQQPDDDHRHQAAHRDGADRAPDDGALAQMRRQRARGERDDDRVVAGEHDVDDDDRQESGEELSRVHGLSFACACHRRPSCRTSRSDTSRFAMHRNSRSKMALFGLRSQGTPCSFAGREMSNSRCGDRQSVDAATAKWE